MSETPITFEYIRAEGKAGRIQSRLMAVVAGGERERVYLPPLMKHATAAVECKPSWTPSTPIPDQALSIRVQLYGMDTHGKLYTQRQLVALNTFCDLISEVRCKIAKNVSGDSTKCEVKHGNGISYSESVSVYLSFAVDKSSDYWSSLCLWLNQAKNEIVGKTFGRQALPMMWDYAEANPFCGAGGDIVPQLEYVAKFLDRCAVLNAWNGFATQDDAQTQGISDGKFVSTDPPYYDNIGYADLSDFFYVWMRRALQPVFPVLLATIAVPKAEELIASPHRHGSRAKAEDFFLEGMKDAMKRLATQAHPSSPITIYYAFKHQKRKAIWEHPQRDGLPFLKRCMQQVFS